MKKISKKREQEIEAMLEADGDESSWDSRELGNDPQYAEVAADDFKSESKVSVGTSIRMPMTLIRDLKRIAEEEGIPYQTLVKSIHTKYIRQRNDVA